MKGDTGSRYRFGTGSKGKPHAPGVRLGNAPSAGCQQRAYAKGGSVDASGNRQDGKPDGRPPLMLDTGFAKGGKARRRG